MGFFQLTEDKIMINITIFTIKNSNLEGFSFQRWLKNKRTEDEKQPPHSDSKIIIFPDTQPSYSYETLTVTHTCVDCI